MATPGGSVRSWGAPTAACARRGVPGRSGLRWHAGLPQPLWAVCPQDRCRDDLQRPSHPQVSTHGYSQNQILVWKYPSLTQVAKLTGHSYRVLYLVSVRRALQGAPGFWRKCQPWLLQSAPSCVPREDGVQIYNPAGRSGGAGRRGIGAG
ncbi:hypothetical protein P7K49_032933 [Saguinus oedipus]|uniref:Uncharacterized protein n=1 Tax=Saguinus oedipus TaxID=9490 RepID=A0ABQ9TQH5_SAGOE|nr:hypothetical protein P7K49_032933 [Saguinus oedipus]